MGIESFPVPTNVAPLRAFQEDVREILLELESARLELNERRDDPKLVALMEPVPKIPTG